MNTLITGIGMISSAGATARLGFEAMCAGKPYCHPLRAFDRARHLTQVAFEIDDRDDGRDRVKRASAWLVEAVAQAIQDANLTAEQLRGIPVLVGTGLRELRSVELWHTQAANLDVTDLRFAAALNSRWDALGPILTSSNACSAGSYMLGIAHDLLQAGCYPCVLIAGADSITQSMIGLVDRCNPQSPIDALRPFDRDRRGVLLGEGAAAVVLETAAHAERRGARPRARLRGVGLNCDAFHETAPDPRGILAAIRQAYRIAGAAPGDTNLLFAHGTGTQLNDVAEIGACREWFGDRFSQVAIAALKSLIGHTSGASGLMSLVTAVLSLELGRVPPLAGLEHPIPEAAGLNFVVEAPRPIRPATVQVNAFGFGGINAVALLDGGVDS